MMFPPSLSRNAQKTPPGGLSDASFAQPPVGEDSVSGTMSEDAADAQSTTTTDQAGRLPVLQCKEMGCGRQFNRKSNLKAHMRMHTGEMPYACAYPGCTKKFKWKSCLSTHVRVHARRRAPPSTGAVGGGGGGAAGAPTFMYDELDMQKRPDLTDGVPPMAFPFLATSAATAQQSAPAAGGSMMAGDQPSNASANPSQDFVSVPPDMHRQLVLLQQEQMQNIEMQRFLIENFQQDQQQQQHQQQQQKDEQQRTQGFLLQNGGAQKQSFSQHQLLAQLQSVPQQSLTREQQQQQQQQQSSFVAEGSQLMNQRQLRLEGDDFSALESMNADANVNGPVSAGLNGADPSAYWDAQNMSPTTGSGWAMDGAANKQEGQALESTWNDEKRVDAASTSGERRLTDSANDDELDLANFRSLSFSNFPNGVEDGKFSMDNNDDVMAVSRALERLGSKSGSGRMHRGDGSLSRGNSMLRASIWGAEVEEDALGNSRNGSLSRLPSYLRSFWDLGGPPSLANPRSMSSSGGIERQSSQNMLPNNMQRPLAVSLMSPGMRGMSSPPANDDDHPTLAEAMQMRGGTLTRSGRIADHRSVSFSNSSTSLNRFLSSSARRIGLSRHGSFGIGSSPSPPAQ